MGTLDDGDIPKLLNCTYTLSFSSAAFFHGQVEQPVRGLMSLVNHKDVSILVAINEKGVFIIDHYESVRFYLFIIRKLNVLNLYEFTDSASWFEI